MDHRGRLLDDVRRALQRAGAPQRPSGDPEPEARLAARQPGPIPERGRVSGEDLVALFTAQAAAVSTTVARVEALRDVPTAIAAYLRDAGLPPRAHIAPDPALRDLAWSEAEPALEALDLAGPHAADGGTTVTPALAGVAETGTLLLASEAAAPPLLAFLPETHVVVLPLRALVGTYEEAWARVRERWPEGPPATINFVSGPSRSGDVEQTIQLGAHGPARLHVLLLGPAPDSV